MSSVVNYFRDTENVGEYSWAVISIWNNVEIISGKFSRAELKLFQTVVDEGWNDFISRVTMALTLTS